MKRLFAVLCLFGVMFTACGREDAEIKEPLENDIQEPPEYNESVIFSEALMEHLYTLSGDDTVKVNVHLKGESYDDLLIKQTVEKNSGIPVSVCNAIENRDFDKTDPYAREWYDKTRTDGDPSFENNIDEIRISYVREYEAIKDEIRKDYYKNILSELPFRNDVDYDENSRVVYGYTATAEELSELSYQERVYFIYPWTETPVEPPEYVEPVSTYSKTYGDVVVSIIFDKKLYSYGDIVNVQFTVHNGGEESVTFAPICEIGSGRTGGDYVSGFYYISAGFYADGEFRRDITCCYTDGYASNDDIKPALELLPGETMSKTFAATPHKSYAFLGEPVSEEAEWKIKIGFELVGEDGNTEYEFEATVPRH